ncbi:MAG: hypothetical protein NUW37_17055 [Planctomycetes bacterium]|nr:hypothetical protein [Planctomycetota bacterium]
MIQNPELVERFEIERMKAEPADYLKAVKIVEAMIEEAKAFGVWPPKNPLEGIEVKIEMKRKFNVLEAYRKSRREAR